MSKHWRAWTTGERNNIIHYYEPFGEHENHDAPLPFSSQATRKDQEQRHIHQRGMNRKPVAAMSSVHHDLTWVLRPFQAGGTW